MQVGLKVYLPSSSSKHLAPLAVQKRDWLRVLLLFVCLYSTGSSPSVRYIQWVCETFRLGRRVSLSLSVRLS